MNTATIKINFAKPDTNTHFWQLSTINHPYEIQTPKSSLNNCSSCYQRCLPLLGQLSRSSWLPTYNYLAV